MTDRAALAKLPVLRKAELCRVPGKGPALRRFRRSDGIARRRGFSSRRGRSGRSQGPGIDPWQAARAFFAAGIRAGDIVHNAFSYHLTPGGFILDEGARALGCTVFPAGTGNTDAQVEAAASLKPGVYCGTPDFLKILLDRAAEMGKDLSSIPARAGVGRCAVSRRSAQEYASRGVHVLQAMRPPSSASSPMKARRPTARPIPA